MKRAEILEESEGEFAVEYDDTRGGRQRMRLEAVTYERAIREARAFLGIDGAGLDAAGDSWVVE
jgi:hypothetical protein